MGGNPPPEEPPEPPEPPPADLSLNLAVQPTPAIFTESPAWQINVENLGPGSAPGPVLLRAEWFSAEAPITLSIVDGCVTTNNGARQVQVECVIAELPAQTTISFSVQSSHEVPGDTHLTAIVSAEDPQPSNNAAALSLNLAATFTSSPAQTLSASGSDIATADLNNDGFFDLVVASEELLVFFNTGQRQLATPGISLGAINGKASLSSIDWNGDGAPDIAFTSLADTQGRIFLNDGSGGFARSLELPAGNVADMISGDLNGDGQAELLVTGEEGTRVIWNDGQGRPNSESISNISGRDLAMADLDVNGFPDVVITDSETREIHVLLNDGTGTRFSASGLNAGSVVTVNADDIDGDGVADLLVATDGADLAVPISRALRNQLDGSFVDLVLIGASPTAELILGDVTADGLPDLLSINETGVHQVYAGVANGAFNLDEEHILSPGRPRARLVDINGDGSLDLILTGENASSVELHANDGLGRFGLGDIVPPLVSLLGQSSITLDVGEPFDDPGATAFDNIDGDLTASILVENPVSTQLVGNFAVTYTVTDRAGNQGQVTRSVSVGTVARGGGGGGSTSVLWMAFMLLLGVWRRRTFLPQ